MSDPAQRVLVYLDFKCQPSDFQHPERRILLDGKSPSARIGRASKRSEELVPAIDNGWIDSPVISREHAQIYLDMSTKSVHIKDDDSRHGTYVNTCRVLPKQPRTLKDGDVVKFGIDVQRDTDAFAPPSAFVHLVFDADIPGISETTTPRRSGFQVPEDSGSDSSEDDNTGIQWALDVLQVPPGRQVPKVTRRSSFERVETIGESLPSMVPVPLESPKNVIDVDDYFSGNASKRASFIDLTEDRVPLPTQNSSLANVNNHSKPEKEQGPSEIDESQETGLPAAASASKPEKNAGAAPNSTHAASIIGSSWSDRDVTHRDIEVNNDEPSVAGGDAQNRDNEWEKPEITIESSGMTNFKSNDGAQACASQPFTSGDENEDYISSEDDDYEESEASTESDDYSDSDEQESCHLDESDVDAAQDSDGCDYLDDTNHIVEQYAESGEQSTPFYPAQQTFSTFPSNSDRTSAPGFQSPGASLPPNAAPNADHHLRLPPILNSDAHSVAPGLHFVASRSDGVPNLGDAPELAASAPQPRPEMHSSPPTMHHSPRNQATGLAKPAPSLYLETSLAQKQGEVDQPDPEAVDLYNATPRLSQAVLPRIWDNEEILKPRSGLTEDSDHQLHDDFLLKPHEEVLKRKPSPEYDMTSAYQFQQSKNAAADDAETKRASVSRESAEPLSREQNVLPKKPTPPKRKAAEISDLKAPAETNSATSSLNQVSPTEPKSGQPHKRLKAAVGYFALGGAAASMAVLTTLVATAPTFT